MFVKSIRLKIVVWYSFILVLVLISFTSLSYMSLSKTLIADLDDMLQLKAEGVSESIETYWEIEKNEGIAAGAPREVFSKINNLNFNKIAQRWVKEQSDDPALLGIVVTIFGPGGKVIATSDKVSGSTNLNKLITKEIRSGHNLFENREYPGNGSGVIETMRVFIMPVVEDKKLVYIVEVASPITIFKSGLKKVRINFYIILPLMIFISAIAGGILSTLIIKPLRNIVENIRKITAENLMLRIKTPEAKDEIRELIETFNTMLEKLDKSFSSQAQLIQDISHEFRTPLTIMRGEMEVVLKKTRTPEEYITVLKSGIEEIVRLSNLVEQLLVLSRYDSHEVSMNIKPFSIMEMIKDIIYNLRIPVEKKHITISINGSEKLIVNGDESQIHRALLNIIENAVKYTDEGGRITIEADVKDDTTRITVIDNGIGISREHLEVIFNRFFRADKSRSGDGYGLGLSISKSIIDAHKGRISVESEQGQGTTVKIDLPTL
jgi:two-component system, OmpR family, sensor kinase